VAALAYSGGLDSSLCVELLRRKYKAKKIIPIMVDVGQGQEEIKTGLDKAKVLKVEPILIDAKDEFTEEWMAKAIMANSDYMGYPVSTSMTRQLIARKVAEKAVELGADALVEGSTGKGNDQYRMHNVFTMFAPGRKIIVPVRDFDLTRSEEEALCRAWGIPVTETIPGGDDKTMWCRSIASGAIDLNMEIPDEVWMWYVPPEKAPDEPRVVELVYEKGIPVALDGERMPLKELVPALNEIAGAHGVGRIDIFEEGIMNLKSRELYEAPAATVILKTHRDLEQMCLTKDELLFKKEVEKRWAYMVYHGEWFHPLREALDAFIAKTQEMVRGTLRVKLFKGNAEIIYRDSPTSLFSPEIRSIKASGFDQRICADAAKIRGLIFEILAKRRQMIGGR
ncbi:TPA: argininosuccinate synthase, partial [Candidatus Poribacteria bacterium]|nr:argininosuccinate synthase [Candidatus Poribacteria bacterium]